MEPICIEHPLEEKEFGPHVIYHESVKETFPLHTHLDFYELFLVVDGKAIHEVNGSNQLLSKGSLVFIRPTDMHCYKTLNYFDFKIFSVGYLLEDFMPLLQYLGISLNIITNPDLPPHLNISGSVFDYLTQQMKELSRMFPSKKCRSFFRSFLSAVYFPLTAEENVSIHLQSQEIPLWMVELDRQMSIRENYLIGTSRIYELCNYSQPHIIRSFKKYFQISPTEYINNKRMNYACELLLSKQYSILEICYASGFNNLSYFYNIFNKTYGCTPTKFLKKISVEGTTI